MTPPSLPPGGDPRLDPVFIARQKALGYDTSPTVHLDSPTHTYTLGRGPFDKTPLTVTTHSNDQFLICVVKMGKGKVLFRAKSRRRMEEVVATRKRHAGKSHMWVVDQWTGQVTKVTGVELDE